MATYPYSIGSTYAKNPGLPEILGDINLKQAVVEGQALNQQHLRQAQSPSQYMPANLADTLQEIREELRDLNNNVKTGRAETANALIRLQNRFVDPMGLHPVQKTQGLVSN